VLAREIRTVLQMERDAEKRLSQAREDAARIVEGSRLQADKVLRETEEEIAREEEIRMARVDEELARLVAEIRGRVHERESFLHGCAERNRQKAIDRLFDLMRR